MIYYCLKDDESDFYTCREADDLNWVGAQLCADDFYTFHDGWEAQWPIEIGLAKHPEGPVEKWFEVSLEMTPDFIAEEIEPEEVAND